jgi:hypothetical protein
MMSKAGVMLVPATKCNGNLITGYRASGVKPTTICYGLFFGTSEVATFLLDPKRKQAL